MVPQQPRRESIFVEVHLTTGEIAKVASTLGMLRREALEEGVAPRLVDGKSRQASVVPAERPEAGSASRPSAGK